MPFVHVQSGIYHDPDEGRYFLFVRWHAQKRHHYQVVDFATVAEAGCFLAGALSASQISKKTVRLETITPEEYERASGTKTPP
jgi:hypothetical protein